MKCATLQTARWQTVDAAAGAVFPARRLTGGTPSHRPLWRIPTRRCKSVLIPFQSGMNHGEEP
jgi:hypothetical protein